MRPQGRRRWGGAKEGEGLENMPKACVFPEAVISCGECIEDDDIRKLSTSTLVLLYSVRVSVKGNFSPVVF